MSEQEQTLYVVIGGEVKDPQTGEYVDPKNLDFKGIFTSYDAAVNAWRAASQQNVDHAFIRYVVRELGPVVNVK